MINGKAPEARKITGITRRELTKVLCARRWYGEVGDVDFLSRLYDLESLPSYDQRMLTAKEDIGLHRLHFSDWEEDWVFTDERFQIADLDDAELLRFIVEALHPEVRASAADAREFAADLNQHLQHDGYELVESGLMSGRPLYTAKAIDGREPLALKEATKVFTPMTAGYLADQLRRMEASISADPALAIGTAKELVESCCKTILDHQKITFARDADIGQLMKLTQATLELTPDGVTDAKRAAESIRRVLGNLAGITQGVAELRNAYGTGHGKAANHKGLTPRHAKLAVGAASTLATFLFETHEERKRSAS